MVMIFSISNKFEYFCALFPKSAERNHSNYRRSGNRKKYYYRWINRQRLLLLPRNFQRSNLRGKKTGIEQLFSKSHYYSANYFLKEEKNNSLMHRMNRMKLFLLTAEFQMFWHICIILETATLLLLMRFAENTFIVKFSFFLPGKKFM